ncbi:MAG: bifunctional phosphopantothenoylcysteine decarboxylase/phosphopantothenate--cysteine ligase CoaBC [Bacillota bacterium]|nr:bifunctional phosphopantothenoylcysteine decarboxylase/phosphopantothenate--cysteine ligase CoaBC [Bacillota bacterium]
MDKKKYVGVNVVVGLTGGIACYKAVEIVSYLTQMGANVNVAMTSAACEFVTPLTLQSISNNPVVTDLFDTAQQGNVKHIALVEKADIILIVPATANFIGKLATGIADDLLSTTIMAAKAPVLIAAAMNVNMYSNRIVQENINKLKNYGYYIIEPDVGYLACGTVGRGRLAEASKIIEELDKVLFPNKKLSGVKVLVTAGGTQEPIDPVRYISNHSSGKMGYAICEELKNKGAEVILVTGPTKVTPPVGVQLIKVTTALEMYDACLSVFQEVDAVIKAAAVADFRPKITAQNKIKKKDEENNFFIELEKNPDILAELGKLKEKQVMIGFAAETEALLENAEQKLAKKNLDMIVANDVTGRDVGFNADNNQVTILWRNGKIESLPLMTKKDVAHEIVARLIKLIHKE